MPNMNTTGRLSAAALLHVRMRVRLTITVCPCQAPVDTSGIIKNIELGVIDRMRWQQQQQSPDSIFVLHQAPTVLVQIDEDTTDTGLGPGVIAVKAVMSEPFSVTVNISSNNARYPEARSIGVRAVREQVPVTIATATTLYTLQGATATPGLIYHFRTPQRLSKLLKWISTYMALSRVRSLKEFRSIGISTAIRDLINEGPPLGMLTRFLHLFHEKAEVTEKLMQEALRELNWTD